MPKIKTAISIDGELFAETDTLAQELDIPAARWSRWRWRITSAATATSSFWPRSTRLMRMGRMPRMRVRWK